MTSELANRIRRSLAALALAIVGCVLSPSIGAQDATPPPLPLPGRLIDAGGWRLHLNCTGPADTRAPRVILEAGVGDFSVEWSLVQPRVAEFARVCSYNRAGDGWSELGPFPRTFKQIVYELHTVLERAGEPASLRARRALVWRMARAPVQVDVPSEVAGMILVDAVNDNPERLLQDGTIVRAAALSKGRAIPPVKTSGPLRVSDIPPAALSAMKAGLADASQRANEPPRDKLPEDARRMRTWALGQLGHVAAAVNPLEPEELGLLRSERTASAQPYGEMPLEVITRGRPDDRADGWQAKEDEHRAFNKALAEMSRAGRQVIANGSGHHIQIEEPDLVVTGIRRVLTAAATSSKRP